MSLSDDTEPALPAPEGYLPPIVGEMIADGALSRLTDGFAATAASLAAASTPSRSSFPQIGPSPQVTATLHLATRIDEALTPIASDVSSLVRPRGWGRVKQIAVGIGIAATIVAAVFSILTYLATISAGH